MLLLNVADNRSICFLAFSFRIYTIALQINENMVWLGSKDSVVWDIKY